MIHISYQY